MTMIRSMVNSIWLVSVVVEVEVTRAGTPTSASLKEGAAKNRSLNPSTKLLV